MLACQLTLGFRTVQNRVMGQGISVMIQWEDRFRVGVDIIDIQHITLLSLYNRLQSSINGGECEEALRRTAKDLIDYAKKPLVEEETLLKRYSVTGLEEHLAEHQEFKDYVLGLYVQLTFADEYLLAGEVLEFLEKWLEEHIGQSDKTQAEQLRALGIR